MLDLLLVNASILTIDPNRPTASSLGIVHGRIVGLDEMVSSLQAERIIDCDGATITPGFGDAHNHMLWFGLSLSELDLSNCGSVNEVYQAIEAKAKSLPSDAWIVGKGYDHNVLGGQPRREALDRASNKRSVWLKHRSGHESVVSSKVLADGGMFDSNIVVPSGGTIERSEAGSPTGVLKETAVGLVSATFPPFTADDMASALEVAAEIYVSEGITHVIECGIAGGLVGKSPFEALPYQIAVEERDLPVRVDLMPSADVLHPVHDKQGRGLDLGLDLGLKTGFGSSRLRLGPVKIWLDGSMLGQSAAIGEPGYADNGCCGALADDPQHMARSLVQAHVSGWQIAAHAIGDRAVDLAIEILAEAQQVLPRHDARHRIEHAGVVRPDQISRLADVQAVPMPQPRFLYEFGDSMAEAVGNARMHWLYRHGSFLKAGLRVPGSSDRPVADGAPLAVMQSMVERLTSSGKVIGPDERVSAEAALRSYTVDEAWVSRSERERGMLKRGYLADFVVLDDNPLKVPDDKIGSISVVATFSGGKCVYGDGTQFAER